MRRLVSGPNIDYSLKELLKELKIDLQNSQAVMKSDLQTSQAANKMDMKQFMDAQFYKLLVSMSTIFIGSLALFESLGFYIHFPWRKPGHVTPPGS